MPATAGDTHQRTANRQVLEAVAFALSRRGLDPPQTVDRIGESHGHARLAAAGAIHGDAAQGHTPEMLRASLDAVCYTKREDWTYESEWRMITWAKLGEEASQYNDFPFAAEELESITLGARVGSQTEQHVRALVRAFYPHCELYRITVDAGETKRVAVV